MNAELERAGLSGVKRYEAATERLNVFAVTHKPTCVHCQNFDPDRDDRVEEDEKSFSTVLIDIARHLLIVAGTGYSVFLIWRWNWIVSLLATIPVYIIMLNLFGFLTLPLYYFFTPPGGRWRFPGCRPLSRLSHS